MKRTFLVILIFIVLITAGCYSPLERVITGSGNLVTGTVDMGEFTGLDVFYDQNVWSTSSEYTLTISQQDEYSITITADDNVMPYIEVGKRDQVLEIEWISRSRYDWGNFYFENATIEIEIGLPELQYLRTQHIGNGEIVGFDSLQSDDSIYIDIDWSNFTFPSMISGQSVTAAFNSCDITGLQNIEAMNLYLNITNPRGNLTSLGYLSCTDMTNIYISGSSTSFEENPFSIDRIEADTIEFDSFLPLEVNEIVSTGNIEINTSYDDLTIDTLNVVENFKLDSNQNLNSIGSISAGSIEFDFDSCDETSLSSVTVAGASSITIDDTILTMQGSTDSLSLTGIGTSETNFQGFPANNTDVTLTDSAEALITVNGTLDIDLDDNSILLYTGSYTAGSWIIKDTDATAVYIGGE